jgi:hypothetical protein
MLLIEKVFLAYHLETGVQFDVAFGSECTNNILNNIIRDFITIRAHHNDALAVYLRQQNCTVQNGLVPWIDLPNIRTRMEKGQFSSYSLKKWSALEKAMHWTSLVVKMRLALRLGKMNLILGVMANIEWKDIDLSTKNITILVVKFSKSDTKGDGVKITLREDQDVIPIFNVWSLLVDLKAISKSKMVFPFLQGDRTTRLRRYDCLIAYVRFNKIFKLTGKMVPRADKPSEMLPTIGSHATRHAFVLICMLKGIQTTEIARMGRWISVDTLKPYKEKQDQLLGEWLDQNGHNIETPKEFTNLLGSNWKLDILALHGENRAMNPNEQLILDRKSTTVYTKGGKVFVKNKKQTGKQYQAKRHRSK